MNRLRPTCMNGIGAGEGEATSAECVGDRGGEDETRRHQDEQHQPDDDASEARASW